MMNNVISSVMSLCASAVRAARSFFAGFYCYAFFSFFGRAESLTDGAVC